MADLTFVAANLHNNRGSVDWLRRRSRRDHPEHYDIAAAYEAHARRRMLDGAPGHRYLTGPDKGPSQETGILLDRRLPLLGRTSEYVSPVAEQFKSVGKERWGQVVVTTIGDTTIAAVSLHPVAGPDALSGTDPDHALVRRYAMAMRWLEEIVRHHACQGHEVVVGMDAQMWLAWEKPWSPHPVFAEFSMQTYWQRIDLIAWTSGLVCVGRRTHDIGSDHPALRVELNINRTKRRKKS